MEAPSNIQPRRCSSCGVPLQPWLRSVVDPQSDERFAIDRCPQCGLGETCPRPVNLGDYYGETYYGRRHGFTARYCDYRRHRILERAVPRPGRVLDLGCGDGSFLLAAQHHGWDTVGVEVGAAAEAAAAAGVRVAGSLDEIAESGPFDAVTLWHTLEHFTDPHDVIMRAASLLGRGGALIVAVPNAGGLQAAFFRSNWFHLDVPRHVFHFTQDALSLTITRAGLLIEGWHHQEIEYDVFGWLQSALNSLPLQRNALFLWLTGKKAGASPAIALSCAMAAAMLGPALALTALGRSLGKGGTMIAVARKR